MTLAEIAATCPNWRNQRAPRPRKGPTVVVDYRALWQTRKHWELTGPRREKRAVYRRRSYQKHRDEILSRLRRKRAQ